MRQRLVSSSVGLVLVATSLLVGCGGSDANDGTPAATTESYTIVSDAVVATGLASTSTEMSGLAAAPETATADAVLAVFENWGSYEGTIKQNKPDAYIDFEDALSAFKKSAENGDAVGMHTAITDFSTMSAQYLAVYPG